MSACLCEAGGVSGGMISPQQYKKLMKSYQKVGKVSATALKAGMDRKTARRYLCGDALPPGEEQGVRHWRTHADAFASVWADVEGRLECEPGLQAKTLFAELQREHPGSFEQSQRRSFERRVRAWKECHGHERERFFVQEHRAGERLQVDWFCVKALGLGLRGEALPLKVVHVVLPCSNWEHARVCWSESYLSLKKGLQSALWALGGVPLECQSDQSSTATHALGKGLGGRGFNERYVSLLHHYGMLPRTIGVGKANQNGDVESLHGGLRSDLEQSLLLRGHRDFESMQSVEDWLGSVVEVRNAGRSEAVALERAHLRALPGLRLPEYEELEVRVNREGIVRVGKQGYSLPGRWIGVSLRVRVGETDVGFYHRGELVERLEKGRGDSGVRVNWRHVIGELMRKPGAFERWRHRESLFLSALWRAYYDGLKEKGSAGRAERDYLNTLHLVLEHGQEAVEEVLRQLGAAASLEAVRMGLGALSAGAPGGAAQPQLVVDLSAYDGLVQARTAEAEVGHG